MRRVFVLLLLTWTSALARAASLPDVLTLSAALQMARKGHPQLKQAEATAELALGVQDAARAPLLPQFNNNTFYQRTTSNFVFRPGFNANVFSIRIPPNSGRTFNFYNFSVTVNQLLYDFGYSIDTFRAAKESARAQSAAVQTALLSIEYNVRNAFFTARANKASVVVAQQTVQNQLRHLEQIEAFVEVGTRPEIDLAQVRADLANARVQAIQAENAYTVARATLNQAMGVEASTDYEVADDTLAPIAEEDASAAELLKLAAERRPELRVLALQSSAQHLTERAAKGQYGPAITANGQFYEAGTDLSKLTWNWYVGASLNWPFYQGGVTRAAVRQARANLASLTAQLELLRQQVLVQLEQARAAVSAARATVTATQEVLENARVRYGLAEGRYEAGVGNIIELEDAQIALTNAGFQYIQAEYNLAIARAQLLNGLGRID